MRLRWAARAMAWAAMGEVRKMKATASRTLKPKLVKPLRMKTPKSRPAEPKVTHLVAAWRRL
jgi:hypothetical protein